jgi:hypothetical protein
VSLRFARKCLLARGNAAIGAPAAALAGGAAPAPDAVPPLTPDREAAEAPPQTPSAACVARLVSRVNRDGGQVARSLVSRSERWGEVWRADVVYPADRPSDHKAAVNRAVCWNDQLQFARGQALPPLPPAPDGAHRPGAVRCNYTPIDNPCRKEPVAILWLCVRPQLYLYADGHAEPAREDPSLGVDFTNRGAAETDTAWAARCAAKGGIYRAEE